MTGEVVGNCRTVCDQRTLTDLGQTYVYEITDQLDATTPALDESFDPILTASPDENIRGISFAPTENNTPCYCRGTLIRPRGRSAGRTAFDRRQGHDHVRRSAADQVDRAKRSYGGRFVWAARIFCRSASRPAHWTTMCRGAIFGSRRITPCIIEWRADRGQGSFNGVSIVQAERVDNVEYFHIELDSHDVIIAEGALPRASSTMTAAVMFHNAHEYRRLYPEAASGTAQLLRTAAGGRL